MKGRLVLATVLAILVVSSNPVSAITCGEAVITLSPCLPFLVNRDPQPSVPCCSGVEDVSKKASSTADRRILCECFKKFAPSLRIDPDRAKQLPDKCSVKLPVPFDPSMDCSKIPF